MAELLLLRAKVVCCGRGGFYFECDALDDSESGLLHRAQLERVVRHHSDFAEAEVEENLGALPVLAQVYCEAQTLVRLDGVRALVLQGVGANLVDDADAAPLLKLVDDCAAPLLLYQAHRSV